MLSLASLVTLVDGLDHPECVAFAPDGAVWAGGEAGQVVRWERGTSVEVARLHGFVAGIATDAHGRAYVCATGSDELVRVSPQGRVESLGRVPGPNYPLFDEQGGLYVSLSGTWGHDDGCVIRRGPDGEIRTLREDVGAYTNGLALSADGAFLYVIESRAGRIVRCAVAGDGLGPPELVADLRSRVPDGLAVDAEGGLMVACYRPDSVVRVRPDGPVETILEDPTGIVLRSPTNVAFHGPELRRLAISMLGGYSVVSVEVPFAGQPLHHPHVA